jgi:hypothetical protein
MSINTHSACVGSIILKCFWRWQHVTARTTSKNNVVFLYFLLCYYRLLGQENEGKTHQFEFNKVARAYKITGRLPHTDHHLYIKTSGKQRFCVEMCVWISHSNHRLYFKIQIIWQERVKYTNTCEKFTDMTQWTTAQCLIGHVGHVSFANKLTGRR